MPQLGCPIVAHVQADAVGELPDGVDAARYRVADGARRALSGLTLRAREDRGGLLHGLDVDLPLRHRGPLVATVHDLSVFDVPWAHPGLRVRGERLLVSGALRRADEVVAVSAFTAARVAERFGRRCAVTPLAAAPGLVPATPDEVAQMRRRYDLPPDSVLCVGTIEPRKRIGLLAEACDRAGLTLVLAGRVAAGEQIPDRARHLGYVESDDLPALYAAADAVAYASCYEGFGLPPVEAMACGAAVVSTRVGALPDLVGQGARLVPPDDVGALSAALRTTVRDADANAALRRAGPHDVAGLSWDRTARTTAEVYRGLGVPC